MKTLNMPAMLLAALTLSACGGAQEPEVTEQAAPSPDAVEATYAIDPATSTVDWTGVMLGVKKHFGTVDITNASLTVKGGQVTGGSFSADLNTITLRDEDEYKYNPEGSDKNTKSMLVGHLKSGDFFDVANHPSASFTITRVEGNTAYGDFTVRGTTHEEKVTDIVVTEANGTVSAKGKLVFDRQKYGVSWSSGAADFVLNNNIDLEITLQGAAAAI